MCNSGSCETCAIGMCVGADTSAAPRWVRAGWGVCVECMRRGRTSSSITKVSRGSAFHQSKNWDYHSKGAAEPCKHANGGGMLKRTTAAVEGRTLMASSHPDGRASPLATVHALTSDS